MGRGVMGNARGASGPGSAGDTDFRSGRSNTGPRRADGTWLEGVERGPYKPFPFPVGARFGNLSVIEWGRRHSEETGRSTGFHPRVRCDCGFEFWTTRHKLLGGHTSRCKYCHERSFRPKRYLKFESAMPDENTRARLLNRLYAAINRCSNPRDRAYANYGGRGIRVASEWIADKSLFLRHVRTLEGCDDPERQMDRIDNDRGYEPGNIRFATPGENVRNRDSVQQLRMRVAELEAEVARLRSAQRGT